MKAFLILKPKAKHLLSIFNKQGKYKWNNHCRGRNTCDFTVPKLSRSTEALNFSHLLLNEQGQVRWNRIKAYI